MVGSARRESGELWVGLGENRMIVKTTDYTLELTVETHFVEYVIIFESYGYGKIIYPHKAPEKFQHSLPLFRLKRVFPNDNELGAFLLGYLCTVVSGDWKELLPAVADEAVKHTAEDTAEDLDDDLEIEFEVEQYKGYHVPTYEVERLQEIVDGLKKELPEETLLIRIYMQNYLYTVLFAPLGIGFVVYNDGTKAQFAHNLQLSYLRRKFMERTGKENYLFLVDYFYKEINPALHTPIRHLGKKGYHDVPWTYWQHGEDELTRHEIDEYELKILMGSREKFDEVMKWFLLTEPDLEKAQVPNDAVLVLTVTLWGEAQLDSDEYFYYVSERLTRLVNLALKEFRPFGETYFYTDEFNSARKDALLYKLPDFINATAREKMTANMRLREWLADRGQNPADFGLIWEKIV
jgi:hypothetical protein